MRLRQVGAAGWTPAQFEASPFHQAGETELASTAPAPQMPAGLRGPAATVLSDGATARGRELTLEVTASPGC